MKSRVEPTKEVYELENGYLHVHHKLKIDPATHGAPVTLSSGVMEYPPSPRLKAFGLKRSTFVFPDGTLVSPTTLELADRFRSEFAATGQAPPRPSNDPDLLLELCGTIDQTDMGLPYDVWRIEGDRVCSRKFGTKDGELTYRFSTPEKAARAAMEQANACANGACPWVLSSSTAGSVVRYRVNFNAAKPTPLRPPPVSSSAPGAPPSGAYQQFIDIQSDTCPTHAVGDKFPVFTRPIVIKHRGGKPFTTLESINPRTKGLATMSPIENVELTPGSVATRDTKHLGPGYTIARKMTVLVATGDMIRVRDEVKYVGASRRHKNLPSNCEHTSITTWSLARKSCDAACDATLGTKGDPNSAGDEPSRKIPMTCACGGP